MVRKAAAPLRRNGLRIRKALEGCDLGAHAQQLVRHSPPLRVLGLDINTNSTGFVVVTERGRVCRWGHIPSAQFSGADVLQIGGVIDEFLATVQDAENQQHKKIQWVVGIEAFLRMFRSGMFNNAGIFQLAQLNGIVSFACWRRFEVLPLHTHPTAARGFFGLKSLASTSATKSSIKHQVMAFLEQQEPELTKTAGGAIAGSEALPIFKRMRSGAWADSAFDIADAYVIAAYTRCIHFQKLLEVQHPELLEDFSRRYLELTYESAVKTKKSSLEMETLEIMNNQEKLEYTRNLFKYGVENWFKKQNDWFMLQEDKQ